MTIWHWTIVLALTQVLVGALYVWLRWRRSPQAYRAMIGVAVGYFIAGALASAWVLHPVTAPNLAAVVASEPGTVASVQPHRLAPLLSRAVGTATTGNSNCRQLADLIVVDHRRVRI